MKCLYCNRQVYGSSGMTVPGEGAAHQTCFQSDQALKRTFQHIEISKLNDEELIVLKDLVLAEENARTRENEDDGDIELF
jgi:hypothetical protein